MLLPDSRTPVPRCLRLAVHAGQMLGKFPERAGFPELRRLLGARASELDEAEDALQAAQHQLLLSRVDAGFEDYRSDDQVRRTCELAGRADESLVDALFPYGTCAIIQRSDSARSDAMRELEARLEATGAAWPDAAEQQASVAESRARYQAAIEGRRAAEDSVVALRARRDAVRMRLLETYGKFIALVESEFRHDRALQALFLGRDSDRAWRGSGDSAEPGDDR